MNKFRGFVDINNSSANINLSKTQLYKIEKPRRIFSYTCTTIPENWLVFNCNVLKRLAKSVLIPLRLTTVASATDAAPYKKCLDLVNILWT